MCAYNTKLLQGMTPVGTKSRKKIPVDAYTRAEVYLFAVSAVSWDYTVDARRICQTTTVRDAGSGSEKQWIISRLNTIKPHPLNYSRNT